MVYLNNTKNGLYCVTSVKSDHVLETHYLELIDIKRFHADVSVMATKRSEIKTLAR